MQEERDPLSNHLILENIFKSLQTPDLKSVRLVSTLWKEVSLAHWRKSAVLVLTSSDEECEQGHRQQFLRFRQFTQMMAQGDADDADTKLELELERKPFSKYKLAGKLDIDVDSRVLHEEVHFFQACGPLVKYLHLEEVNFPTFSSFEHVLTRTLPNLKKLVMSNACVQDDTGGHVYAADFDEPLFDFLLAEHTQRSNFQRSLKTVAVDGVCGSYEPRDEFWTQFFYCMPSVENVTVRAQASDDRCTRVSMNSFMLALRDVRRLHPEFKIRSLDIMDFLVDAASTFSFDLTDELDIVPLPDVSLGFDLPALESLSMDWGYDTDQVQAGRVIESVGKTLQVFKVFRAPVSSPFGLIPFALAGNMMNSLRELHLYGNVMETLTFLHLTPNLKVLVMNSLCFEKRHKFEDLLEKRRKKLVRCDADLVLSTREDLRERKLTEISVTVPSLEYLETDYEVGAGSVGTLATWLPNVRKVKLVLKNDDSLSAVCGAWPKLEELECKFRSRISDVGISSLVQCSDLSKFRLNAFCGEGSLTSSSVDHFMQMKALRELHLSASDKFSQEAEAALLEKIGTLGIIRTHDEDLKLECCKWRQFLDKVIPSSSGPSQEGGQ